MGDHCIICAETLQFCAYGQCGHKETCSKCVLRLRSMLKDPRCAYCQQQLATVYVTRFAGDYTQQVAADDFDKLQERADAGELFYLAAAQAYFDDPAHFRQISSLCSFTHPLVAAGAPPGASRKPFHSLRALRSHLQQAQKLQFCDICLEGRKVFVSEQQLYSRQALERHLRQGDSEGPMAESGFKGHPECHFCRKRFFGENELYQHMHTGHEECFVCRRAAPHRHVYYRDYADLEGHFKAEHFPCEHPACAEEKFVVFPTEQELRTHTAREHGQTLSRSERKQALTIPLEFTVRRGEQSGGASSSAVAGLAAAAAAGQGAVVIGGAASVPSRFSQHQQRRGSRANLAEQQQQAATRASVGSAQAEQTQRESVAAAAAAAPATSNAAQQQQQQAAEAAAHPGMLREVDFPSVSAASGAAPAVGGRWAGGGGAVAGSLTAEDFPALPGTSRSAKRRGAKKKTAAEILAPGAVRVLHVGEGLGGRALAADNFPALGAAAGAGRGAQLMPLPRRGEVEEWQQAPARPRRPPSSQEVRDPLPQAPAAAASRSAAAAGRPSSGSRPASGAVGVADFPTLTAPGAAAPPPGGGGVSEALRAANRALVEKIKGQLGNEGQFGEFRQRSATWVRGELTSRAYHDAVAALGLVSVVPELAATCPDPNKRAELLAAHAGAFTGKRGGVGAGTWMPPEAAAAAASHAARHCSWHCAVCPLVNAPAAATCEACGHPKPQETNAGNRWRKEAGPAEAAAAAAPRPPDLFPPLPTSDRASTASGPAAREEGPGGGNKGKQKKQSLNQFTQATRAVHTQNLWRNPALRGEWAADGGGVLAQQERALKEARGKK